MNSCLPLAKQILLSNVKGEFSDNVLVSPLSLYAIAAALGAGCSGRSLDRVLNFAESKNLDELKLRFSDLMSIVASGVFSPKISYVNGVWVDIRFRLKPSYQQCLKDTFKAQARNHDFENQALGVARDINSWAELETNGLIKNLVEPEQIDPSTAIILGNALYFKGFWQDKFDTKRTKKRDFYLLNGDKVSVPFMTSSKSYLYGSFDDFKVLEIPYQRGRGYNNKHFSMQLILPHRKDGLRSLLEKFNADSGRLDGHFDGLRVTEFDHLWIPKFKFSSNLVNIKFPFMDEPMDLTEMLEGEIPPISTIIQKSFIEVDEEGTEAAAVTLTMGFGSSRFPVERPVQSFVAEHPFIFIIKEEISGLILFMGAVLNPAA